MGRTLKDRWIFYFKRFLDPKVSFRQKVVSLTRYFGMLFSLVGEKFKGVDYLMIHQESNGPEFCGNYTATPKKIFKRIKNDLGDISNSAFFDVGCGKGYAIKLARKIGFKVAGGIEYNKTLYDIMVKNFKIDNINSDDIYCGMAQDFEHYGKFDVIYFNNPFDAELLSLTLNKIHNSHLNDKCLIYYLNVNNDKKKQAFIDNGFKLIKIIEDPSESYFALSVYENTH